MSFYCFSCNQTFNQQNSSHACDLCASPFINRAVRRPHRSESAPRISTPSVRPPAITLRPHVGCLFAGGFYVRMGNSLYTAQSSQNQDKNNSTHTLPFESEFTIINSKNINEEDECPVCLESANKYVLIKLKCGHTYHHKCAVQFLKKSSEKICAICRQSIFKSQKYGINSPPKK